MLSSREICEIIRECGAHGVASFKITKDLVEIKFGVSKATVTSNFTFPESMPQASLEPQGPEQLEFTERDPKEIAAEDELQELQITDPLEYESRIARGELVDGNSEQEE
jgi:hypothetical protein